MTDNTAMKMEIQKLTSENQREQSKQKERGKEIWVEALTGKEKQIGEAIYAMQCTGKTINEGKLRVNITRWRTKKIRNQENCWWKRW